MQMVAGVKAPAGAPVPAHGERLHQIGNRAEALRIRAEVQGRRHAYGIGRHRLRQHQIARERIEHVLPRPHRLRIAQRHRLACLERFDDVVDDGDVAYTIVTTATSADVIYNGINAADVAVTNTDNDGSGITVSPIAGLTTTEAGGSATFTVVLT